MVTIEIWRARIGSHNLSGFMVNGSRSNIAASFMSRNEVCVFHFFIIFTLLVIGNIELNPGPNAFQCKSCNAQLPSVGAHAHHQRIHLTSPNFSFSCGACLLDYKSFKSLQAHISKCHKDVRHVNIEENSDVKCPICSESLQSVVQYLKHIREIHVESEENGVVCPLIDECLSETPFKTKSTFSVHVSKCHGGWKNISEDIPNLRKQQGSTETNTQDAQDIDDNEMSWECHDNDDESFQDANDSFSFTEDDIFKFISNFYTMLEAEFLLSTPKIDNIAELLTFLSEYLYDQMKAALQPALRTLNIPDDEIEKLLVKMLNANALFLSHHKHVRGPCFTTDALRKKFFIASFPYLHHDAVPLNPRDPLEEENYQYVSVKGILNNIVTDPSIEKEILASFKRHEIANQVQVPMIYKDYTDGQVCKDRQLPAKRLDILLFQDAFSATSMLTTVRQKHKTLGVYMTLGNICSRLRTKLKAMYMLMLVLDKHVKQYRQKCFRRLVSELKDLEENGIEFMGEKLPVYLQFITGDNAGQHFIGGFIEGFTAHYFCRFCNILKATFKSNPNHLGVQKTQEYYNQCVQRRELRSMESCRGVKEGSLFNELNHFKICDPSLPSCIGHDLFHGVADWDLAEIIKHFVDLKWFSYQTLNRRINNFKYSTHDSKNKPAPVKEEGKKLGGSAVQNWTLLRLLPFIIDGLVKDYSDKYWQLYLQLKAFCEYACAPAISSLQVDEMDQCIDSYLIDRAPLLTEARPKHHWARHMAWQTKLFGPLIHLWGLRFEHKHQFFKKVARACNNFINLLFTLAKKHQLLFAYQSQGSRFEETTKCSPIKFSPKYFAADVCSFVLAQKLSPSLNAAKSIELNGTKFNKGLWFFVRKESATNLYIGLVEGIVLNGPSPFVVVREQIAVHNDLTGLYEIPPLHIQGNLRLLNEVEAKRLSPLSVYIYNSKQCFSLKHTFPIEV